MTRVAGKRGLRGESHRPELLMSQFRQGEQGIPDEVDVSHGIIEWGMDNNGPDPTNPPYYPDGCGDCGAAMADHANVAKSGTVAEVNQLGRPKFAGTLATYFAYGVGRGERGAPPAPADAPDKGVDNASWFGFLYEHGIIDGYGEVPLEEIHQFIWQFSGVCLGVRLSDSAEADFEAEPQIPWGSDDATEPPDPSMGHDVLVVRHVRSTGAGTVITWGAPMPFVRDFIVENAVDAWVVFDELDARRAGYNWTAIKAALEKLHGKVKPVPANA